MDLEHPLQCVLAVLSLGGQACKKTTALRILCAVGCFHAIWKAYINTGAPSSVASKKKHTGRNPSFILAVEI